MIISYNNNKSNNSINNLPIYKLLMMTKTPNHLNHISQKVILWDKIYMLIENLVIIKNIPGHSPILMINHNLNNNNNSKFNKLKLEVKGKQQ